MGIVSRTILNDWQRGKLPYFIKPPAKEDNSKDNKTAKNQPSTSKAGTSTAKKDTEDKEETSDNIKQVR